VNRRWTVCCRFIFVSYRLSYFGPRQFRFAPPPAWPATLPYFHAPRFAAGVVCSFWLLPVPDSGAIYAQDQRQAADSFFSV